MKPPESAGRGVSQAELLDDGSADLAAADAPELAPAPGWRRAPAVGARPAPKRPSTGSRRQRVRMAVVGAILIGAVAFLLVQGIGSSLDYFDTVDQAVAQKAALGTHTFRLEGLVVPGTVHSTSAGVSFVAAGTHHRIQVVNTGNPPELFQPDIPVVVVGHFVGTVFDSNQIIVDHSAQYQEQYPARVRAPDGTSR